MKMTENELMQIIQREASKRGARLWRNNVGLFQTRDGRKVRTGLAVGSSDLIGFFPRIITRTDLGKVVGVFFAVETKIKGRKPTQAQENFIKMVNNFGGRAGVVRSLEDFWELVNE